MIFPLGILFATISRLRPLNCPGGKSKDFRSEEIEEKIGSVFELVGNENSD